MSCRHPDGAGPISLAQGANAQVSRCGCGALTVSVGPVSVRVSAAALADLHQTLHDAREVLELESGLPLAPRAH